MGQESGEIWTAETLLQPILPKSDRLLGAVVLTFALQMATIYIPFLNPIFHTRPLTLDQLGLCLLISTVVFFAVEPEKWIRSRD